MAKAVLILGGTAEARQLADAAQARWPNLRIVTSLAGRTVDPRRPAGEVVTGGFGGAQGLAEFIARQDVQILIDATHPFADEISASAARAAASVGVPRLVLVRPPWRFPAARRLRSVADLTQARRALDPDDRRLFLAIGRQEIDRFADDPDRFYLLRFIDPPGSPPAFADCHILIGRPGDHESEQALLAEFEIDVLIAKNGGSDASRAKVDAAVALGVKVLLIDPPPPPPPPRVESVEAALDWLTGQV